MEVLHMAKKNSVSSLVQDLELSSQSPWVIYGKKLIAIFSKDPSINITTEFLEGVYTIYFNSSDKMKMLALSKVLKRKIRMGNIEIELNFEDVGLIDDNPPTIEEWITAFKGNYYFSQIVRNGSFYIYAVFKKEIVSIYTDNMTDYCLNDHYIVADIIRDVTRPASGLSVCTQAI
jgi:hypothetical protein